MVQEEILPTFAWCSDWCRDSPPSGGIGKVLSGRWVVKAAGPATEGPGGVPCGTVGVTVRFSPEEEAKQIAGHRLGLQAWLDKKVASRVSSADLSHLSRAFRNSHKKYKQRSAEGLFLRGLISVSEIPQT